MHTLDIAILVIISVSALISVIRGFVREALSLLSWVVSIWIASTYATLVAHMLSAYIAAPTLRFILGFAALFVATLFLGALINFLITHMIKKTGLSGMLFGVVRGGVVVGILVMLAGLTTMPQAPWWQESMLIGHFETMVDWMRGELPPELTAKLTY